MPDQTDPTKDAPNQGRPSVDPSFSAPPPPPPGYAPPIYAPAPTRSGGVASRVVTSLITTLFITSIMLNIYFAVILSNQVATGPVVEETYQEGQTEQRIAILPVIGMIDEDTAVFIRQAMQALDANPPAALVLRVDSGGGGVGASDRIWHHIDVFRAKHPDIKIVASYGSLAASGGYYVSAMADHIYAEPTCVTGSIGVMGQLLTFEGLLEKIGVDPVTMVASDSPDKDTANDLTRSWTEQDRTVVQGLLDSAYDRFVEVVAQSRSAVLTEQEVRDLATGRIFTAKQAQEAKLIDEIGYIDDAISKAVELSGLPVGETPRVTVIGKHRTLVEALMGAERSELPTLSAEQVRSWILEMGVPRLSYSISTP